MKYYWFEWEGAHSIWTRDGQTCRCLMRITQDPDGWWRIRKCNSYCDFEYITRYKTLERAKGRAAIEVRFFEGEMK